MTTLPTVSLQNGMTLFERCNSELWSARHALLLLDSRTANLLQRTGMASPAGSIEWAVLLTHFALHKEGIYRHSTHGVWRNMHDAEQAAIKLARASDEGCSYAIIGYKFDTLYETEEPKPCCIVRRMGDKISVRYPETPESSRLINV